MKSRWYQRMIMSLGAVAIIATGVFAPLSFGVQQKSYHDAVSPLSGGIAVHLSTAQAQNQGVNGFDTTTTLESQTFGDICGTSWGIEETGCSIVLWVAKGAFKISGILAGAVGGLFDYMLWFTIQSSTYADSEFIETGWGILRDLANIIFIVALIIAALNIMLSGVVSLPGGDGKKMLASVIVAALLVNFSLFFAQVIVDASHILARTFYNRISTDVVTNDEGTFGDENAQQTPISVALIDQIDPQQLIINPSVITASSFGWTTIVAIYTFMTIVHGVLIFIFLSMALMFIGRTVALMFGMIVSPFAFATLGTPLANLPYVGFGTWMKDLAKNAFMVPVFLFFLYLTVLFMGGALDAISKSLGQSLTKTLGQQMIDILIPMSLVIGLLMGGKSAAGKMASEMASQANSLVGKGVGLLAGSALTVGAGGLTMGAGALGGALSKGAGGLLSSGAAQSAKGGAWNKFMGATKTKLGSKVGNVGETVKNANVDVRSSFLGKQAMGMLGAAGVGSMAFGEGKYTSAKARSDERQKEALARAERDAMLRNQSEEEKKKKQDEIIVNAQANIDDVKDSAEYKLEEKKFAADLETEKKALKDQKGEVEKAAEALKTAQATGVLADIDKAKNELKAQNDIEREMDKKVKKKEKELEEGSFYKGNNTTQTDTYKNEHEQEVKNIDDQKTVILGVQKDIETLEKKKTSKVGLTASEKDQLKDQKKKLEEENNKLEGLEKILEDNTRDRSENNDAYKLWSSRKNLSSAENTQKDIDQQINLNNRRAIKQELDLMTGAFSNISSSLLSSLPGAMRDAISKPMSSILAGLPGAVVAGVGALTLGAPMGALALGGLVGGGLYAAGSSLNSAAHGFTEQDRDQLRQLFRKTTKKEDK